MLSLILCSPRRIFPLPCVISSPCNIYCTISNSLTSHTSQAPGLVRFYDTVTGHRPAGRIWLAKLACHGSQGCSNQFEMVQYTHVCTVLCTSVPQWNMIMQCHFMFEHGASVYIRCACIVPDCSPAPHVGSWSIVRTVISNEVHMRSATSPAHMSW